MQHHLLREYRQANFKFQKFQKRLNKRVVDGSFYRFSARKRRMWLRRVERIREKLKSLLHALKLAGAGVALATALSLTLGQANAQTFIEAQNRNPLQIPIDDDYNTVPTFVDMDNDGDMDLVVGGYTSDYDETPFRFFENVGDANTPIFRQRVDELNPLDDVGISEFCCNVGYAITFGDIDGDGDLDAFVGTKGEEIIFYENTGNAFSPFFEERTGADNPLDLANSINFTDYRWVPALADMDMDGDLDMVVAANYDSGGLYEPLLYFENTGDASNPSFVRRAGVSNPFYNINNNYLDNSYNHVPNLVDFDGDGDMDLFIGESGSSGGVQFFENYDTGTPGIGAVFSSGYSPNIGNSSYYEPAPALADIDGDGDLDALVGNYNGSNHGFNEFWRGDGTLLGFTPSFQSGLLNSPFSGLISRNYNNNLYSYYNFAPALVDIDNDGDLDIFIGNSAGDVFSIENTGTAQFPDFNSTPQEVVPCAASNAKPTFAKIDGDADFDLYVGLGGVAYLDFFENTGSASSPAFAVGVPTVGFGGAPTFGDVDDDGDLDVFLGQSDGTTNFLQNLGTPITWGGFMASPYGLTDVGDNARPVLVDWNGDGLLDLFVAQSSSPGTIIYFQNMGTAALPAFVQNNPSNPFNGLVIGDNINIGLGDIDNDGDLDLFIGNSDGSFNFLLNQTIDGTAPAIPNLFASPANPSDTQVEIVIQLDEPGDVFFVVIPSGATAPTEVEILAGTASGGAAAVTGGSFNIATAFEDVTQAITGLSESTTYDIYLVAQDAIGNNSLAQTLTVATTSTNPAITASASNITDLAFDLTVQVDEAADIYYLAVLNGDPTPTEADIIAGTDALGEEPITSGMFAVDTAFQDVVENIDSLLAGTAHDVYVLAQDAAGNDTSSVVMVTTTLTTAVSASDSLALVALYNSTDGDNWVDKSKWLNKAVDKWFGITIKNQRVTRVELISNGLIGPAPSDLRDLTALGRLNLSDNEVNELPNLSRISTINILAVENNRLRFEDIIPNLGANGFTFDPQKNLMADETQNVKSGKDITLSAVTDHPDNTYKWFKDGTAISSETGQTLVITKATLNDIADYNAAIDNSQVSGLQLNTGTISLKVVANISVPFVIKGGGGKRVDKGEAFIFKITEFNFYDTVAVQNWNTKEGAFFGNLTLDDYVIFGIPDEDAFPNLLPTYWREFEFWDDAETLELSENFIALTTVQKRPAEGTGTGRVIGELFIEDGEEGKTLRRRRVRRGRIALRRARVSGKGTQEGSFKIVAFTQTDDNGFFEFPGLELAEHEIKVDWPGIPMNLESDIIFDVTETTLELVAVVEDGLCSVFIIGNDTLGIKSNVYDRQLIIYPNPAQDRIFIELGELRGSNYSLSISDISGKVVSMALINPNQIKTRISVDIGHLKQGLYLVRLHDDIQKKVLKVSRLLVNR